MDFTERRPPILFAVFGALALGALLVLSALVPGPKSNDLAVLLLLGLAAVALWTPLGRRADANPDAATWLLFLAMAVVYSLARRAGPQEGYTLNLSILPDSPVDVPYATRVVLVGALLSVPAWVRNLSAPLKAVLAAAALVAVLGVVSFQYLRPTYTVGEVEILNPRPIVESLMQCLEYAALGLCCAATTAHPVLRRFALRALPLLLVVWARHAFRPVPVED